MELGAAVRPGTSGKRWYQRSVLPLPQEPVQGARTAPHFLPSPPTWDFTSAWSWNDLVLAVYPSFRLRELALARPGGGL